MDDGRTAATLTRPQISVRGATKNFSGRIVVNIDELLLGERPIEGLIGPNGAGKTTLMRMIMHSTPLDGGTIEYFRTGEHGKDRKSTRLNSSHALTPYAVFCLKKKNAVFFLTKTNH